MNAIPKGWIKTTLEFCVDIRNFEREPINSSEREDRINGKNPDELFGYYGATGKVGLIDDYRSEGERVLLGEDAAPFLDQHKDKAYLVKGKFWVNNHAHVLYGASGIVGNAFVCHQLNIIDYHPFVTGSTRLKLTSAAMKQIPLLLAPAAEQTRIVEKLEELLSDLDAGVAELKAAQRKLGQYRQSLLKAAVEGALTASWRAQHTPTETGAQLLERILTERRARWEAQQLAKFEAQGKAPPKDWRKKYPEPVRPDTEELPTLPQGWIWSNLDSLIDEGPQNGLYLPATQYGRGTPILRIDDYQIGWHRPRAALNMVDADRATVESYSLKAGDMVINRVNSMTHLGKSLNIDDRLDGVLFESNMMRLRLSNHMDAVYVSYYLGSDIGRSRLIRDAKWAVNQASINQQDVKRTPIPVSSQAEQKIIAEILQRQFDAIDNQFAAIDLGLKQSAAQRKNILKAAFSGQLVPQDPNDEPAAVLLERIRAQRAAAAPAARRGRPTKATA